MVSDPSQHPWSSHRHFVGLSCDKLVTPHALFWSLGNTPFAREAALARKLGTDKGMQIGLDGVQLLGGHGFTKEHPVERWYRDLRAIGVAEGVVVL
jgi:alkylation response protein AidB-like acyl-CoA dehydrogenase